LLNLRQGNDRRLQSQSLIPIDAFIENDLMNSDEFLMRKVHRMNF